MPSTMQTDLLSHMSNLPTFPNWPPATNPICPAPTSVWGRQVLEGGPGGEGWRGLGCWLGRRARRRCRGEGERVVVPSALLLLGCRCVLAKLRLTHGVCRAGCSSDATWLSSHGGGHGSRSSGWHSLQRRQPRLTLLRDRHLSADLLLLLLLVLLLITPLLLMLLVLAVIGNAQLFHRLLQQRLAQRRHLHDAALLGQWRRAGAAAARSPRAAAHSARCRRLPQLVLASGWQRWPRGCFGCCRCSRAACGRQA